MADVINTPMGCEWAPFRGRGEPSCPDAKHPYALACPWCPNILGSTGEAPQPVGVDT